MKKVKVLGGLLMCVILLSSLVLQVNAGKTYGEVIEKNGYVKVNRAGGERMYLAYNGMKLIKNDMVITSSNANAKISYNGKIMTLNENTRVYINELYKERGKERARFTLWAGSVWNVLKEKLGFDLSYEVYTPSMVIGVRGTEFGVEVNDKEEKLLQKLKNKTE